MDEQIKTPLQEEQDLNEILRIRREKLASLQAQGKNPFEKVRYDRTAYSQDIKDALPIIRLLISLPATPTVLPS